MSVNQSQGLRHKIQHFVETLRGSGWTSESFDSTTHFLRQANLSAEKLSQIVSAGMSRYEYEPLRDATLTAILRAGALRGSVPLNRKQPGTCSQVEEAPEEEDEEGCFLEANEEPDDELEAEYQEAVALMTIAKQRRAEVDQARQFFRKLQSSEDRTARLDKLKRRLPCVRCGRLGQWKDDNECPAKVKVVNWEQTEEQVTEESHPFPVTTFFLHTEENNVQLRAV